jgi:hypothetical protein
MMDKRTIGVVIACMLALFALQTIVNKIYPPVPKKPKPVVTNIVEAVTNAVEEVKPPPAPVEVPAPTPTEPAKIVALSNAFMRVEFTSRGGGIGSVAGAAGSAPWSCSDTRPIATAILCSTAQSFRRPCHWRQEAMTCSTFSNLMHALLSCATQPG